MFGFTMAKVKVMLSYQYLMQFCETCDSLLQPKKLPGKDTTALFCIECNEFKDVEVDIIKIEEDRGDDPEGGKMLIIDEDDGRTVGRPSGQIYCPRCDSIQEVEYWEIQTRSADESPTRFFKCLTCKKQWREYD